MAVHKTSKLRSVDHEHDSTDLHAADQAIAAEFIAKLFPNAEVINAATLQYNCHGFALAPSHLGWFNFPDFFLADDYIGTPMGSPQLGDILVYSLDGILTHTALVIEVSGGTIVRVQSKWGGVAEVKHAVCHVPDVYGEPLVLLRPQPGIPPHPALNQPGKAAATSGAISNAPVIDAIEIGATESADAQPPKRFALMLASTPEVRRRILRYGPTGRAPRTESVDAGPEALNLESTVVRETSGASTAEGTQDDIQKALAELMKPHTQFELLLASTPDVLRTAASRLQPVKDLLAIHEAKAEETKRAVLEFFERPETQRDEQVTGLALFLLTQISVREAVAPIARYLLTGTFSSFNGGLAVDALRKALDLPTN